MNLELDVGQLDKAVYIVPNNMPLLGVLGPIIGGDPTPEILEELDLPDELEPVLSALANQVALHIASELRTMATMIATPDRATATARRLMLSRANQLDPAGSGERTQPWVTP